MSESSVPSPIPSAPMGRGQPPLQLRLQRLVDIPSRWGLAALGAWVLYRTSDGSWPDWGWLILGGYGLLAVAATGFWLAEARRPVAKEGARAKWWAGISYGLYIVDALFISALIWRDGGLGSPLYILLALLAVKAVSLAPALPRMMWLPFTFGPLYAAALWLAAGSGSFLADAHFLGRYVLLWAWLIGVALIGFELARRTRQAETLAGALVQGQAALALQTEVLQRTATDLGDRLLELRALQEVAKALATTLRTEETLQLVVERLASATGSSHCAVALIEPEPGSDEDVSNERLTAEGAVLAGALLTDGLAEPLAFRLPPGDEPATLTACEDAAFPQGGGSRPIRVAADCAGRLGVRLGGHPYYVTALVSRGHPIGALYVAEHAATMGRPGAAPALNTSEQLLTSFAYFAATALENARLYQDAYEKRRELEAVLSGIGDGVVVAAPDLSLILMNPVARDILSLEAEPPTGVPLKPYLSAPTFADLLAETLRTGQEQIRELDLSAPAKLSSTLGRERATPGEVRTYGALASPVLDASGEVSGVVAVLRDITAQKEVERMKSNFLSVVSHELRTPLHSIKGFVEIILMGKTGPVTELQEDFLKTVRTQTTVLQRMIDDLLEFSRMEAGRIKLNLEEVSLAAVAQGVATKLAPLAQEGNLTLYMDFPDDLPTVDGDRVRLEQVLTNLVENAIKFTPQGGEVTMGARRDEEVVRVTVHDTGIGIPPEEQDKVFDRFYQVDRGEKRAYRGTGLGLAISKHIVERHNGAIWVESDGVPGHGASFHVELPVELRLSEAPTIDFTTSRKDGAGSRRRTNGATTEERMVA